MRIYPRLKRAHKVMHEHSWVGGTATYDGHSTDIFTCKICGVLHTSENPTEEFKPTFAYFYALKVGAPLGRIFAFYGG